MDLIKLGVFKGNEEFIRYTKGGHHTITVFRENGKTFSWDFGDKGDTIVSDNISRMQKMIVDCIERELDIYCGRFEIFVNESLKKLEQNIHIIEMKYYDKNYLIEVYKNGEFYDKFLNYEEAIRHFKELKYNISDLDTYEEENGKKVDKLRIVRPNPLFRKNKKTNLCEKNNEETEEYE